MTDVTDIATGGPPSTGTKPDQRLKRNKRAGENPMPKPARPPAYATESDGNPGSIVAPATGAPFTCLMLVEGLETSDGRMFELGSTTWRQPPIPFMAQDTSPHGPGQTPAPAWAAGQINTIERDPSDSSRIIGHGNLMANDQGQRAEQLIRGAMRGVSVDAYGDSPMPPDVQPKVVDEDGQPISVLVRYADSVISRLTLVPTPAFAPCCVWMDDEDMPAAAQDAHGGVIDTDTEPEVVQMPPGNSFELLVASGGGPVNPEKAAFFQPEPNHRQEMIVAADGTLTGHLVGSRECHTAYPNCELAPTSKTRPPFVAFHRTEAHCADGSKVACGWIPIDTHHSKLLANGHREAEQWSQEQTWQHYEDSGMLLAKVRASNGRHGIWLSGCLLPGLTDRALAIAQGLSVSGHWNVYTDPRDHRQYADELLGILGGVAQPGYPETRTRPELLVASGKVVGHIAGSDCGCDDCDNEEDTLSAVDVERIAALERTVSVLVAFAGDEALAALNDDGEVEETDASTAAGLDEVAAAIEEEDALATDSPLTTAERARWFAKYNTADRKKMASSGAAMPDGSFPIADEEDLHNAIRAVGRAGGDHNAVRKHIAKRASALGKSSLIPDNWNADGSLKP